MAEVHMSPTSAVLERSAAQAANEKLPFTLVLGGGGYPAIAYMAGALKAIEDSTGIDPAQASLIIGTSAGAVVGALLRSGVGADRIVPLLQEGGMRTALGFEVSATPAGYASLIGRLIGSAWVMFRALSRIPVGRTAMDNLQSGLCTTHGQDVLLQNLAPEWPADRLWLITVDLFTNKRRALSGKDNRGAALEFGAAVMASTAIPMLSPPVDYGDECLVDGGVHSSTHADLALEAAADPILCLAPICFDRESPPSLVRAWGRWWFQSALDREKQKIERAGRPFLLIAPAADQLQYINPNFFDVSGLEAVRSAAYNQVCKLFEQPHAQAFLGQIRAN